MIGRFNEFLTREGFDKRVELKGSFCMERCGEGINWMFNDEVLSSPSVEAGAEMFQEKVRAALQEEASERPSENCSGRRS
jgi:NADH:ubiquinone oxidoreductase subunit E